MKKTVIGIICALIGGVIGFFIGRCDCGTCEAPESEAAGESLVAVVADGPNIDLAAMAVDGEGNISFPIDDEGYYILFNGTDLTGWRGYGMDVPPASWEVSDGAIHLKGSGTGEAQAEGGGDLIFAHKFQNFELQLEYKISEGGNSGIFYLAQEVKDAEGKEYLPIWQSCSEYQVLDNAKHPDAQLGVDGNRQAASLYDMIPAKPQNAKPAGEWNQAKIMVYKGTVVHGQNGVNVLEYHLWTPKWTQMLQDSKFAEGGDFPYAFNLLNNMGGENHEGYIGLQDHGDDVWYRNIRIKLME